MDTRAPVAIQRLDYQPPVWSISHTRLTFELDPVATRVTSVLTLHHKEQLEDGQRDLVLQGVGCALESVSIDGRLLPPEQYRISNTELTLTSLPEQCLLTIVTVINPEANKALEGLYRSSGNYCTQCEAEGFRKITYYLDRPDVLSVFDVIIIANAADCPVLLCNGNLVSRESLENGLHKVHWHDPYPKPSYLFALVAGDLANIEERFVTASGRDVLLQIFVQQHNIHRCEFAMQSLVAAMRWDERVYGLEYDLDRFMIVAVDDFNMGAMENKGLNIFNSRYVLADRESATDSDYRGVESVIAHEYFHNWTGNRITCRDWFQLSLKEGLTVFRDQCFSSDQHSATVKRIEDVRLLRARQFPEDAGPMAHPIRPESYIEINNFYTLTVYEKGAEVIRMLHTLLGPDTWRKGMDTYVARHDGSATTCEAFVDAMQAVSDLDLSQFRRWYSTAGTPELLVEDGYDAENLEYWLRIEQHCPDTPGQTDKAPLHIPVIMGLLDETGKELRLSAGRVLGDSVVLDVMAREQTFYFKNISSPPVASLLRGFSAPVKLKHDVPDETLAFLMAKDSDAFNRWDAGQRLAQRLIFADLNECTTRADLLAGFSRAIAAILKDESVDPAFKAEALTLPSLDTLAEELEAVDFQALARSHSAVMHDLALHHGDALQALVCNGRGSLTAPSDSMAMGLRSLCNTALSYLSYLPELQWEHLALLQYQQADNMTDRLAALAALCHSNGPAREQSLDHFYQFARDSRLVMDKWFAVQACARRSQVVDDVEGLLGHPAFEPANPNRVRSLMGSFAMNNPIAFHDESGRGYHLLASQVIALDGFNPQLAARMVGPLCRWKRLSDGAQQRMKSELERIMAIEAPSADLYEMVSKSLA